MASSVVIVDLSEVVWCYLGEGNMHIVLELEGSGRVIRLHKESVNEESLRTSIEFVSSVMQPLLLMSDVESETLIKITAANLDKLNEALAKIRPSNRLHKNVNSIIGTRAQNFTVIQNFHGTSYCIEIKPKLGFIPQYLQKYGKCSYCMKQYLKLSNREIKHINKYCPMDLYSGEQSRMKKALLHLIENPQNNFKVFINSKLVFNNSSDSFSDILKILPFKNFCDFLNFLVTTLGCKETSQNYCHSKLDSQNNDVCKETTNQLCSNSVLARLSEVQKFNTGTCVDAPVRNKYGYVENLLKILKENNLKLNIPEHRQKFLSKCDDVSKFMISAIARDCSIMIAFSESNSRPNGVTAVSVNGRNYVYSVAITDLEPKSTATIQKRKRIDREMIQAYQTLIKSGSTKV